MTGAGPIWFFMALGSAICWGLAYTLTDKAMRMGISSPLFFVGISSLVQAFVFLGLSGTVGNLRNHLRMISGDIPLMGCLLVSICAYAAGNLLIFLAIREKNAAMANLVEISYPFFTILFSLIVLRESAVNGWALAGGILIFCGIALIYLKG